MAGSVNKVILVGNLGADPEIRTLNSGDRVANLRIATSETWRDRGTGERGGTFAHTKNLYQEFGKERLVDTPISELGFTGAALGASFAARASSPASTASPSVWTPTRSPGPPSTPTPRTPAWAARASPRACASSSR